MNAKELLERLKEMISAFGGSSDIVILNQEAKCYELAGDIRFDPELGFIIETE